MQIVRDERWNSCLQKALTLHGTTVADENIHRRADAIWALRARYQQDRDAKKGVQLLTSFIPPQKHVTAVKCQCAALTMTGKKCQFKATCGTTFCKKHQLKGVL